MWRVGARFFHAGTSLVQWCLKKGAWVPKVVLIKSRNRGFRSSRSVARVDRDRGSMGWGLHGSRSRWTMGPHDRPQSRAARDPNPNPRLLGLGRSGSGWGFICSLYVRVIRGIIQRGSHRGFRSGSLGILWRVRGSFITSLVQLLCSCEGIHRKPFMYKHPWAIPCWMS